MDSLLECGIAAADIIVVTGDNRAEIENVLGSNVRYAMQKEQLGTAHALLSASELSGRAQRRPFGAGRGQSFHQRSPNCASSSLPSSRSRAHCTFVSAVFPLPTPPYGRIIRDVQGRVCAIVEDKDASPEQRQIREVNASIYLFDNRAVFPLLAGIRNDNAKKEYYLTDIIAILHREKLKVEAVQAEDCAVAMGINDRRDLQLAQEKFNRRNQERLMLEGGVSILQPETVTIEHDVEIGRDTVIYPCTYLAAGTRIGKNCSIGPFAYLKNARIGDGETVRFVKQED